MQSTVWTKSFTFLKWEFFLEKTSYPLVKGFLPTSFIAAEGSRVILWRSFALIISLKEPSHGPLYVESREAGETL
jgi:hypothetical protein